MFFHPSVQKTGVPGTGMKKEDRAYPDPLSFLALLIVVAGRDARPAAGRPAYIS